MSKMTRVTAREVAVRLCFADAFSSVDLGQFFEPEYFASLHDEDIAFEFLPDEKQRAYITALVEGVRAHTPELDSYIEKYSSEWRVDRISGTATAVLRVAMYETLYTDVPPASALNAAIDILKFYDNDKTVKFVNGILGTFTRCELG